MTRITNNKLEKFRLNFSSCANPDAAPLTLQRVIVKELKNYPWYLSEMRSVLNRVILSNSHSSLGRHELKLFCVKEKCSFLP